MNATVASLSVYSMSDFACFAVSWMATSFRPFLQASSQACRALNICEFSWDFICSRMHYSHDHVSLVLFVWLGCKRSTETYSSLLVSSTCLMTCNRNKNQKSPVSAGSLHMHIHFVHLMQLFMCTIMSFSCNSCTLKSASWFFSSYLGWHTFVLVQ